MDFFTRMAQAYSCTNLLYRFSADLGAVNVPIGTKNFEDVVYACNERIARRFNIKLVEAVDTIPRLTLQEYEMLAKEIVEGCKKIAAYITLDLRFNPDPTDANRSFSGNPCSLGVVK